MKILLDFSWAEIGQIVELALSKYEEMTRDKVRPVVVLEQAELFISDFGLPLFSRTVSAAKEVGCVVVSLENCPVLDSGWLGVLRRLGEEEAPARVFRGRSLHPQNLADYLVEVKESRVLH